MYVSGKIAQSYITTLLVVIKRNKLLLICHCRRVTLLVAFVYPVNLMELETSWRRGDTVTY